MVEPRVPLCSHNAELGQMRPQSIDQLGPLPHQKIARPMDAAEKVVVRKQLRRSQVLEFFKALPACLVGTEACATAHYWARELTKLGHQVRLMPAKDVKAYVKRNKNDAADAEAICEAVRRARPCVLYRSNRRSSRAA
jgi:transposase